MFSLTRWQPSTPKVSRQKQTLDPFFGDFFQPFEEMVRELDAQFGFAKNSMSQVLPHVDISETSEALYVLVDVPGYDGNDIDVRVEGELLRISGKTGKAENKDDGRIWHRMERRLQSFERAFTLPATVDASKTDATCKNGVLTITLPKREEAKPKSISVKIQS